MKIATWNVNSLNVRKPQVLSWLAQQQPAILGLQELKQVNEAIDNSDFAAMGYQTLLNGQKTYNGVALIYQEELGEPSDVVCDIPALDDPQRRVIAATFGELRVINAYVVNGEAIDSEKYQYKLNWLEAFSNWLALEIAQHPNLVVMGDFNIAPSDADVFDPERFKDAVLCSPPERDYFNRLLAMGFTDALNCFSNEENNFTWWDYRGGGYRRNHGLRIDHILTSPAVQAKATACHVDKEPRGWERPSDHAPVVLTLA
ncbi:exodeoxyribonuclease III [Halothiobacillus neapolitanus]|uniref:Exodeoxyribonuclease III Xth n=1 Tax=Halothiobacillus neapolitanus (strain ATCC 23641 / DSM 15147 / CIP 104769 / NCIMB 8539 / c2) TaxID=555778 RepID=D0KVU6_HALNC|nr:exodeoxyribonuclease III [Halothiobacillus neapolitanus]ACX94873.1 exodeoxyribonuclease III Xth [Halothiobacillus neapolitanus c2]TDN60365.1 exodeoxyribonuclease III [Halothiobacillus neapolitanus]